LKKEGADFVVHDALFKVIKKSKGWRYRNKFPVCSDRKLGNSCDIFIALGGDGTILRFARLLRTYETPILGINLGKLGFLAEVSEEEVEESINDILKGEFDVESRTMLTATTEKVKQHLFCLNDIVLDKYGSSKVMDIETYVNDEYLATYTGDGIIVSTPTGSTAYALATGGPVVTPDNKSILLCPLSPHALTARPLVVPEDSVVTIKVSTRIKNFHITADGQVSNIVSTPSTVTIKKAPFVTRLIKRRGTSYFDLLRRKLQWGRDVRFESSAE
jgi:NAD+ kinase